MDESGGSAQPRPGNNGAPHDTRHEESPSPAQPPTDTAAPTPATPGPDDEHTPSPDAPTAPTGTPGDEHPTPPGRRPAPPGGEATTPAPTQPAATDHRGTPQPPASSAPDTPADATRPTPPHSDGPTTPQPHVDHDQAPPADTHPTPRNPHSDTPSRASAHSGTASRGRPPQRPKDPGGGILMGRPFGVPVYVAPSWFLVAALITWVFGGQLDRVLPELGAARYLVSLFFAVAFYASVLVHELAHTVAALRFKLPVRRIQLQFFGGASEIEKEAETPGREFVLAFVGPLLSLALAGIFYLALQPVEPGTVPGVLLAGLMVSNLIVAAFNLLPGLPLDGGRMLRAVVWKITGRPMSGTIAAAWVGRVLAIAVLIGLPLLTQSGALGSTAEDNVGMDTVTDALLAAILAAIIWTGAGNSLRMARLREHLPELRARTLTRRAVPVETDTPLSEALRRANAVGARALVVVDAHGRPLSLVREAAIVGVPEHRRPWVPVSGLAQELTDGMRVSAELAGEDLLDALRATPATEYLVVEETGEIYGVLSAADVERAFVKAMARPTT
ncbi:site-2 protease family protein [Streptomyces sp. Ru72]|uniref:site-2 protease family protein n=1 Tax=Streptomyces sp. Ru72 TaxID=2080747 RepID=UPI000CDDBA7F|nr:site-2 protease family protein [Streptomyces sp. Ru72]POX51731.1 peptidase [Streptomyces sp. Ru72]